MLSQICNVKICFKLKKVLPEHIMYASKRFAFSPPVHEALHAALDYNHHNHRPEMVNAEGNKMWVNSNVKRDIINVLCCVLCSYYAIFKSLSYRRLYNKKIKKVVCLYLKKGLHIHSWTAEGCCEEKTAFWNWLAKIKDIEEWWPQIPGQLAGHSSSINWRVTSGSVSQSWSSFTCILKCVCCIRVILLVLSF